MAKGKVAAALVAAGSVAGAAVWKLRRGRSREHVDLYYADGSMVSLAGVSPEGARLLPIARRTLSRARTVGTPPA
jgi:hypothetical protein